MIEKDDYKKSHEHDAEGDSVTEATLPGGGGTDLTTGRWKLLNAWGKIFRARPTCISCIGRFGHLCLRFRNQHTPNQA